jgi:hypothetical protein
MVTRNGERVTCHLPGLDQRDRSAGAPGRRLTTTSTTSSPRNGGNGFEIHALATPLS